jgi:hypothetical protein
MPRVPYNGGIPIEFEASGNLAKISIVQIFHVDRSRGLDFTGIKKRIFQWERQVVLNTAVALHCAGM